MAKDLQLRSMQEADLEEVAELEDGCAGGWSRAQLLAERKRPGAWQLVAVRPDEEKIIGYIIGVTVLDEAEIFRLVVSPSFRRRGYGSQLVKLAIDALRPSEVRSLFLEVRESNRAAFGLYLKLGFSPVGRRKKYYANPTEDAYTMRHRIFTA